MKYNPEVADVIESVLDTSILNIDEIALVLKRIQDVKEDSKTAGFFEELEINDMLSKVENLRDDQVEGFKNYISEATVAMLETDENIKNKL